MARVDEHVPKSGYGQTQWLAIVFLHPTIIPWRYEPYEPRNHLLSIVICRFICLYLHSIPIFYSNVFQYYVLSVVKFLIRCHLPEITQELLWSRQLMRSQLGACGFLGGWFCWSFFHPQCDSVTCWKMWIPVLINLMKSFLVDFNYSSSDSYS